MQANPYQVKMPLLRVAHPSEADNQKELDRLKSNLKTTQQQQQSDSDFQRDISTKGVTKPQDQKNPLLFDFDHNYDPALTPRRPWQQKVIALDAKLDQTNQQLSQNTKLHSDEKSELEKQILLISNKLKESETNFKQLESQIAQETKFKDDYQRQFERAQFDLDTKDTRHRDEQKQLQDRLVTTDLELAQVKKDLASVQQECAVLKDENHRLKNTIVNKDSQNETLQQLGEKEKDRREAETAELRRMLVTEQDRAIRGVREAEQNIAKGDSFKLQIEKMETELLHKDRKIQDLQTQVETQLNLQVKAERELVQKLERERMLQQSELDDKSTGLEVRLNKREADLQRMESTLMEMHTKMDTLQQERKDAQFEAKQSYKLQVEAEKRLEVLLTESRTQREALEQQVKSGEDKVERKTIEMYRNSLTMQVLERKVDELTKEVARLQQVSKLGESVARLPAACVESLSEDRMRDIKQTALHEALVDLKNADKGRDDLVHKIQDLENRQKKAYLRLYERVGDEIGASLHKSVAQHEAEIQEQAKKDAKLSASELEMQRLKTGMEEMGYGGALSNQKPVGHMEANTLDDLFRKYNV